MHVNTKMNKAYLLSFMNKEYYNNIILLYIERIITASRYASSCLLTSNSHGNA